MRHRISGRKFNRPSDQRGHLLQGLAKSLIKYEQIKTTLPKAKDLRPIVEKMITVSKNNTLASRRRIISLLGDQTLANKLLTILAERYSSRLGGYTRIIKAGFRYGDAAPMAIIEFIDRDVNAKPRMIKENNSESLSE